VVFARRNAIADIPPLAHELDVRLLQPLVRKYAVDPPQIVHYTSVETLEAILASGKLRMTHFRYLNDSTEMLRGRQVADHLMGLQVDRHDAASPFFDYCRFLFAEVDDTAIQYFVTSFSVLSDCAEMWARYGGSGAGVAIAFDVRRMGAPTPEVDPYHIGRVTYTAAEQLELISPLVDAARNVLLQYTDKYTYDVRDVVVQILAAKLCSHLNHHSISLKNEAWSSEQEWRTIFSVLRIDPPDRKARIKLRSDGRPYVDVEVRSVEPDDIRLPIVSVTVGASANATKVTSLLKRWRYDKVTVRQSVIDTVGRPIWPGDSTD
jgi:hypothetical protein